LRFKSKREKRKTVVNPEKAGRQQLISFLARSQINTPRFAQSRFFGLILNRQQVCVL
jgi:hypothetical protein